MPLRAIAGVDCPYQPRQKTAFNMRSPAYALPLPSFFRATFEAIVPRADALPLSPSLAYRSPSS